MVYIMLDRAAYLTFHIKNFCKSIEQLVLLEYTFNDTESQNDRW